MSPKSRIFPRQTSSNIHEITTSSPRKYDTNNNKTSTTIENINSPRNEERQRRLMEIKRRAKMIMKQDDESDDIQIFAPSK